MDKKGYIVAPVSLKTYFILVIIGILFVIAYFWFISGGAGRLNNSCPENLVPLRLDIEFSSNYYVVDYRNASWLDGSKIDYMSCRRGNKEGENTNYIYCDNVYYSGKIINKEGIIEKDYSIYIDIIINSQNQTEEGFQIIGYECDKSPL